MKLFVEMPTRDGKTVDVNPMHVAYVADTPAPGFARLVFGAVNGGLHDLWVTMPRAEAKARLESFGEPLEPWAAVDEPSPAPAAPKGGKKGQGATAAAAEPVVEAAVVD